VEVEIQVANRRLSGQMSKRCINSPMESHARAVLVCVALPGREVVVDDATVLKLETTPFNLHLANNIVGAYLHHQERHRRTRSPKIKSRTEERKGSRLCIVHVSIWVVMWF
jgi:hypothetical protein